MQRHLRLYLLLLVCLLPVGTLAQLTQVPAWYGWHNPALTYARIVTNIDGMYLVPADSILAQVSALNGATASELKLYFEGQQVPMHVGQGSNPGNDPTRFDAGDWIEFFGRQADASVDSFLFRDPDTGAHVPDAMPVPKLALASKETSFFLTSSFGPGMRYEVIDGRGTGAPVDNVYRAEVEFLIFSYNETTRVWGLGSVYNRGTLIGNDYKYFLSSEYSPGEGLAGIRTRTSASVATRTINLDTRYSLAAGTETRPPVARLRYSTDNLTQHNLRITMPNRTRQWDFTNVGIQVRSESLTLAQSDLRNASNNTQFVFDPQTTGASTPIIGAFSLEFDSRTDFLNATRASLFEYTPGGTGTRRLLTRGFLLPATDSVFLFDLTNRRRVRGSNNAGTLNATTRDLAFQFPASNPARLRIVGQNGFRRPMRVLPGRFANLAQPDNGADLLIVSYPKAAASANAYAEYRRTEAPLHSRMSVQVVFMDEVLNEFGYGIQASEPLRQFLRYVYENWQRKPKYILFWGDMYQPDNQDYIPAYGYPPSDFLMLTGYRLDRNDMLPWAALGRVTVQTNADGFAYLNKVKEYESMPYDPAWMREALHLGGGYSTLEQQTIQFYLRDRMAPTFSRQPLNGIVDYFQNTSGAALTAQARNEVATYTRNRLNQGVTALTLFGHAAATEFDLFPQSTYLDMNNPGKYPMTFQLGCFSGDFTSGSNTFGERYMKEVGKGAITFTAMTGEGDINMLGEYMGIIYNLMYGDSIGRPIGNIKKRAYEQLVTAIPGDFRRLAHAHQFLLQGDPCLRQRVPTQPDLAASTADLIIGPDDLLATTDSIEVQYVIKTEGLSPTDSVRYQLRHFVTQTGVTTTIGRRHWLVGRMDTLRHVFRRNGANWAGQNTISLTLDPLNEQTEISEENNEANVELNLESNVALPIYPQNHARLASDTLSVIAGTFGGPSPNPQSYDFQLATAPDFTAPLASETIIGSTTGAAWRLPTLSANQLYWWRARLTGNATWTTRSFRHVPGARGWRQATTDEFRRNSLQNLTYNTGTGRFAFGSGNRSGSFNAGVLGPVKNWGQLSVTFDSPDAPGSTTEWLDIRVFGRRRDGTDSLALRVQGRNLSVVRNLASVLDAARFPTARLDIRVADTTGGTPIQPVSWEVDFEPLVTDAALDPLINFSLDSTNVREGQPVNLQFAVRNLSPQAMADSIPVQVLIQPEGQNRRLLLDRRIAPLGPMANTTVTYTVPTTAPVGARNTLLVQLHPSYVPGVDAFSLNNQYSTELRVRGDRTDPLLDVTVDGRHVMNGERVSPLPNVLAELRDDNQFQLLTDTTALEMFLNRVDSIPEARRLSYSNGELNFTPASTTGGNAARVAYRPLQPLADGQYELTVQGYDVRGNAAGTTPVMVQFEVRNRTAASHVLNYPNPFTTSTRFLYTINGTDVPEVFQIHIHTITGKLVKVIDLKALGEAQLGTRLTDYAWDGTDEFGDRLANGVYLYRVIMRLPNGQEVPIEDETGNTSRFFKNGWGKMYLMK